MCEQEEYEPQEHDELAAKVYVMIKEEVESKIKGTVDGLEYSNKRNGELQGEIYKLRTEIRKFESEKQKALKEKEKEVMRDLFNGLHPGDTVFYPKVERHKETCTTCGGKHKVDASLGDGRLKTIECPDCDYSGKRIVRTQYLPVEDKLRTIIVEMNDHCGKFFKMYLHKEDRERRHDEAIFSTLEDCQNYCEEKNKPEGE